jgi:hypothetical protein
MNIPDATHPMWELLGYSLRFSILAFVLWVNVESFDKTEIMVLVGVMFGDGVVTSVRARVLQKTEVVPKRSR